MSQFQVLLRKRTELIDNIKRLNKLLVENRGIVGESSSHMYGIDIISTIRAIEKDRRLIILCLLNKSEAELRNVNRELSIIREE